MYVGSAELPAGCVGCAVGGVNGCGEEGTGCGNG